MGDLAGLVAHLRAMQARVAAVPDEAAALTAPMLGNAVRGVFGDEAKLAPLKDETIAEKARRGYASRGAAGRWRRDAR